MIVLGSERALENKMKAVLMEFGYRGKKARAVCKCDSIEEANKKAERSGLGSRWFTEGCCEEVREEDRLDLTGVLKNNLEYLMRNCWKEFCESGTKFRGLSIQRNLVKKF